MRLFVAVWPSPAAVEALNAINRPDLSGIRWTSVDQWHVTLRFDGDVPDAEVDGVTAALGGALATASACTATSDGTIRRFGRGAVGLIVDGLGDLAACVDPLPGRPFRGHLTLARFKTRRPPHIDPPPPLAWRVDEVTLVCSHLGEGPARYEVLRRFPLLNT